MSNNGPGQQPWVLVITDKFAPHSGGTAVCWTQWVKRWPPDQVSVVTRRFSSGDDRLDPGYKIRRVPFVNIPKLRMPLLWLGIFVTTLFAVWQRRPTVIHCAQIVEMGWIGYLCKRLFGIPYVVHFYGEEIRIHKSGRIPGSLQSLILREAAGVSVLTRFTEALLRSQTGYSGSTTLAYPGVDLESFRPLPGLERSNKPILLTLGRLMKRKGHAQVLQAVARLQTQFPELQYLIVGVGPFLAELQSQVRELRLEGRVRFLGRLDHDEVLRLLNTCRVFVHPNRELPNGDVEGFGIVFLEASACGLPVIGGDSGGTPEAIQEGLSGFLVDPEKESELAERIGQLLRDAGLWQRMSQAGPAWAAQFTWERSSQALWELTQRVHDSLHSGNSAIQ